VSAIHTLNPGDVLATGHHHRGLSAFRTATGSSSRWRAHCVCDVNVQVAGSPPLELDPVLA